jgi:PilZ domain
VPLFAPLAVSVEIRAAHRRVFRLSRNIAESGVMLERPAPFEVGHPVNVSLTLPDEPQTAPLVLRSVVALTDLDGDGADGGRQLEFVDPPRDVRGAIARYVTERLGLRGIASRS